MITVPSITVPRLLFVAALFVTVIIFFLLRGEDVIYSKAKVERGDVISTIGVSGYIEAPHTARLTFPTTGVVTAVFAKRGDFVQAGTVLATLGSATQIAERSQASASLVSAEASRDLIRKGIRSEAVSLAEASVSAAEVALEKALAESESRIAAAQSVLYSTQLEAHSTDGSEKTVAPTVTGSYSCEDEGEYIVSVYSSNSKSGYSYRYHGLEDGTQSVTTKQPTALGSCGLYLQFEEGLQYNSSEWTISIPNERAVAYPANKAALLNTITTSDTSISAATQALATAQKQADLTIAPALSEELRKADALVNEARARVLSIDSTLADRSIVAPFDGIVTDVDVVTGEVATQQPLITLLAQDEFELIVRIPEIDSTKVKVGQAALAAFDASPNTPLSGEVVYISPLATEIDGVAYFETRVLLSETPEWIRSGLNADVDIVVTQKNDVLRLPRRFISESETESFILQLLPNGKVASSGIEVGEAGNNGYIEILSLPEGSEVIAP